MSEILAVVDDLFFLAKIQQTAKLTGIQVEPVAPQNLMERLRRSPADAVLIDLNHRSGSALAVLSTLKNDAASRQVPVLAFLSHVQTDLAQAARAAGCDLLLARSSFSQRLPELLCQLAGKAPPPTADR